MRFLSRLTILAVFLSAALVALKFRFEHLAAPRSAGLQGALRATPTAEVLFFGSSHTRQSYDVRLLEELTGAPVFLVAYNGLDYANMVPLVEVALGAPSRRPALLVVEAYGVSLTRPPDIQDPRLFFESPPQVKCRLVQRYVAEDRTPQRWFDIFDLVANRNSELLLMYPVYSRLLDGHSYRGGYVGKQVAGLGSFEGIGLPEVGTKATPAQEESLRSIVRMARDAGVSVLFIESPLPSPVYRQVGIRRLGGELERLLSALAVPFVEGSVVFPIEDPRYFADSNHLSSAGRELFTRRIAVELTRVLGRAPPPAAVAK